MWLGHVELAAGHVRPHVLWRQPGPCPIAPWRESRLLPGQGSTCRGPCVTVQRAGAGGLCGTGTPSPHPQSRLMCRDSARAGRRAFCGDAAALAWPSPGGPPLPCPLWPPHCCPLPSPGPTCPHPTPHPPPRSRSSVCELMAWPGLPQGLGAGRGPCVSLFPCSFSANHTETLSVAFDASISRTSGGPLAGAGRGGAGQKA